MKRFFAFVKKEFYHIMRDQRTMLILFGLPMAQVLIFGFALSNEIKNAKIALLDKDHSFHSQQIINRLFASGYFQLHENLSSEHEIEQVFRKGIVKMVLVFPVGFSENLAHTNNETVQIIADATEQNTAISLTDYATGIISTYTREQNGTEILPQMQINVNPRLIFNPELKSAYVFVPGVMAMVLLLVSALMTSITIAREKETGTLEVLMVSPLSQLQILFGKMLPYLLLSFLNGCLIIVLGVLVLGMPLNGSLVLLLSETLLFIFLALAIGLLISTLADTQLVAMFASLVIMLMPTIFLSGFIFPIESMPPFLQYISKGIPASWFITIVKGIMIKGIGIADLWQETLILFGYSVALMALSLSKLKTRLG